MASKNKTGKGKGKGAKNQGRQNMAPVEDSAFAPAVETPQPDNAPAQEASAAMPASQPAPEGASAQSSPKAEDASETAKETTEDKAMPKAREESANAKAGGETPASRPAAAKPAGPRMPEGISKRPLFMGNPYMPLMATVQEIIKETPTIRTLRLALDDEKARENFHFEPGQVGQISVFGSGEATFVINSPPSQKQFLQFSVMKAGEVTDAIHRLSPGDKVGLRAPLGNYFPYQDWKGKNVFFIGGGIGMAPIRVIMLSLLENKADYGKISLLYGARSPKDMAYSYELDAWKHNPDLDCTLCIDNPYENWEHKVGLIPTVLEELAPSPDNTVAVLCGPPIMIKFTLQSLRKLGFEPENIITTLEKRMKCGIGICGRCNIGDRYVCVDGPVFSMKELEGLPPDI